MERDLEASQLLLGVNECEDIQGATQERASGYCLLWFPSRLVRPSARWQRTLIKILRAHRLEIMTGVYRGARTWGLAFPSIGTRGSPKKR